MFNKKDKRHDYIFEHVADALKIDKSVIEEIGCSSENMRAMDFFFKSGGPQKLVWFYFKKSQSDSLFNAENLSDFDDTATVRSGHTDITSVTSLTFNTSSIIDSERADIMSVSSRALSRSSSNIYLSVLKSFMVTTEMTIKYALKAGVCVYFLKRDKRDTITENNVHTLIYGSIQGSKGILEELKSRLDEIMLPTLKLQTNWGFLSRDGMKDGEAEIQEFLQQIEKFSASLGESINALKDPIRLEPPKKRFQLEPKSKFYAKAAQRAEIVSLFEETLQTWMQQIEVLLNEVNAIREESDDAGPNTELEYWKTRQAKFNSITDQLQTKNCKIVLGVLKYAKSPLLKRWKELDIKITDASNEAKDNVKYLSTLEKYSEPLYVADPVQMIHSISGLINAIKMMHSIARYYNTSERMTALFVKITNQMIKCCRNYILKDGTIWSIDRNVLIERFKACIELNETYQHFYRKTKTELKQNPFGKQFDFSESAIFGKFDKFTWRLQKLIDVFNTINQFCTLEQSTIENIGPIINKFNGILTTFKRKRYDFLDYKNEEFDKDYLEFNMNIAEIEQQLVLFINNCFSVASTTEHSMRLLTQFRSVLNQESLQKLLDEKHRLIFNNYGRDLENIKRIYERYKKSPPLGRNVPIVAGNIAWARQLLRKIEGPMEVFQRNPSILPPKDAKRINKLYNKLAATLIGFETLWYEKWCELVQTARDGLHATLLVRHPKTNKLYVNFDYQLMAIIREVKMLEQMGFQIPDTAKSIYTQEDKLRNHAENLKYMVKEYYRIMSLPKEAYLGIMKPLILRVNQCIEQGLYTITWTSLNIDHYIKSVFDQLEEMEQVILQANDIVEYRLEYNCDLIAKTILVEFKDEVRSIDQFLKDQLQYTDKVAKEIDIRNQEVESATNDLIKVVTLKFTKDEVLKVRRETQQLQETYSTKVFDAVVTCLKNSVKYLKDRISGVAESKKPVLKAELELLIPNIVVVPKLEEIQRCVNKSARIMLESTYKIYKWNQDRNRPDCQSIYDKIGENRETIKGFLQLTGAIAGLNSKIQQFVDTFKVYEFLWRDDRYDIINDFKRREPKPTLEEFEQHIKKFHDIEYNLEKSKSTHVVESLSLDLKKLKNALKQEAIQWKIAYGQALNEHVKENMNELLQFMEDTETQLNRKIEDLESVNNAMIVLNKVRELESKIEIKMKPIEDAYLLLTKYHVKIPREEQEHVDSLRYKWKQLVTLSRKSMDYLRSIGPDYRKDLLEKVKAFQIDVKQFKAKYDMRGPMQKGIKPREAVECLKTFQSQFEERERKMKTYSMGEKLFGLKQTEYPELMQIKKELGLLTQLYDLYTAVIVTINGYEDVTWENIDIQSMSQKLGEFNTACKKMPMGLRKWDAYLELKEKIENFYNTLPLLEALTSESIKPRHWKKISEICKVELDVKSPEFKVKNLLDANLVAHADDVEEIIILANKETEIETRLEKIKNEWNTKKFVLGAFKNRGNLILKDTNDLMTAIEDSQVILSGLIGNPYNAYFRKDIQLWMSKLSTTQTVIDDWLKVQALWIYMEAVFTGGDIAKNLPKVAKRFSAVDRSWVKIMATAESEPNVIKLCYQDEMLRDLLPHLKENLEKCQKSLSGYLEAKRMIFPRFFFLSDAQLLEILGQGSDPTTIQKHLLSIFANIAHVDFDTRKNFRNHILSMNSAEGEHVKFSEPVVAIGNIEDWLQKLVDEMKDTIHDIVRSMSSNVLHDLNNPDKEKLTKFIEAYPSQISLLGIQMLWTYDSEMALRKAKHEKGIMNATNKKFQQILTHLVSMTVNKNLTPMERTRIETLITIHIHQCDIFQQLVRQRVRSATDFEWLKQTRFYWKPEKEKCIISITDVDFEYCNEFLGCRERLVITPLTDRIYISCAQAMGMFLGGAPAGPAGTGKTETTKDMGTTMGKYFITINCSDQMGYISMGMLFKGIALSGIWCGFDEINRVHLEVLSVVASQISCIFEAMKNRAKQFVFTDGTLLKLDPQCGIFITMNPGYAGRTELPENMKALFRTIAVVVPDRAIIMRVRLAASGFQDNQTLSKKFYILYNLCEQQLSKQNHYDFGLRNILSVLRTCGSTLRDNPDASETKVLMRVLRDMNMSKLVDEDGPLFLDLIKDLFPGQHVEDERYEELENAIEEYTKEKGLIYHKPWVQKIIQFYEQYRVRHGICIMGPSGTGKSSCISMLHYALSKTDRPIRMRRMNPKAITANQMFGTLDPATNDWTDGIFSALWRIAMETGKKENTWIVLDGPVDTLWIENLNTVLDDTKTLTLASGDRLGMPKSLKLIFEVADLDNASPATVSRMGMIYIGKMVLGWRIIFEAWCKRSKRPQEEINEFKRLFENFIDPLLLMLENEWKPVMMIDDCNLIQTTLKIIDGLFMGQQKGATYSMMHIQRIFIFAVMWSIGGVLSFEDRRKLHDEFVKMKFDVPPADENHNVFDYMVDTNGNWVHWKTKVQNWEYPQDTTPEFNTILVPTVDSVRTEFLIDIIAKQRLSVLLIGESGTAKTVTIQQYIDKQDKQLVKNKLICFSSATSPELFQKAVFTSTEKRMGNTFGPPAGKLLYIFIDDINMPEVNEWGDQVTNEIVRQLIEDGGFYSLDPGRAGVWLSIVDVQFFGAMMHPGGGRNDIPNRLKRHFAVFNLTLPNAVSVEHIFGKIATGHFSPQRHFTQEVVETAKYLPSLTRKVWSKTKIKMLPTPAKFHYVFNLRDLSRIFQGMLYVTAEAVDDKVKLLRLWRHECERVIMDKFINDEDRDWFKENIRETLSAEFDEEIVNQVMRPVYFVDFLREIDVTELAEDEEVDESEMEPKIYEQVPSLDQLQQRLQRLLVRYNEKNRRDQMDLVLFEFAMIHLMRISRIIRTARGNALLIGVGGSGKQSLTKLASFIAGYNTYSLTLTKNYNIGNLMEDLKDLYKKAMQNPVTFLFTDNDVKDEQFLEYINMILTSGEIPGLFPKEEFDVLQEDLRQLAMKTRPGFISTPENLYKFFIDRVRDNLHVVLCFSPVGEKLRIRARKFPGLISGCTVDWFPPWPVDALHATAEKFVREMDIVCTDKQKDALINYMTNTHEAIIKYAERYFETYRRSVYVTPKSYLSFIESYKQIYALKYQQVSSLAKRVETGLNKLAEASAGVAQMRVQLTEKKNLLAVARKQAAVLLEEVTTKKTEAEEITAEVKKEKDRMAADVAAISKDKAVVEKELEQAKPALEQAKEALNSIDPKDIATLKKLGDPPGLVKRVMDGVLLLFHNPLDPPSFDDKEFKKTKKIVFKASWKNSQKMMSDVNFLKNLQTFDKDSVNDETCELLEPLINAPDFNKESVMKVSGSVAGIATWVKCMVAYHEIAKNVAPKIAKVREAEDKLSMAKKELAITEKELAEKEAILAEIQQKYDESMRARAELEEDARLTEKRMQAAQALILGLKDEKDRWTEESQGFENQIKRLIGDVAICATFLCYTGPFNKEYRTEIIEQYAVRELRRLHIPVSDRVDVEKMLATPTLVGEWSLQGLPNDSHSIQNGIIVTNASRYPLLIDPQGQGKAWIMNKEAGRIVVTNFNAKDFRTHLENTVQGGQTLLIEDIGEELDPILDPLLDKRIERKKRHAKIKLGDRELMFDDNFKLFITTKLPNPKYSPEISAKTSIVDFTVTFTGLEDQLLGIVIRKEMAELEEKRKNLLNEIQLCKKTMADCENELLEKLSSSQKNLLDDDELIEMLASAKEKARVMKEKLANAEETEKSITEAREEFRPVAERGSVMYFVITELSLINCMYQTSLKQFINLFEYSLEHSKPDRNNAKRIENIIQFATYYIYKYVQRGLYAMHKHIFALLLALKIDLQAKAISQKEFDFLLRGGAALDLQQYKKHPAWISDNAWLNVNALSEIPTFKSIVHHIESNEAGWKKFYDANYPEQEPIPDDMNLSPFHKLLLIRALRDDRTRAAATMYIINTLSKLFVEDIPARINEIWEESTSKTPIIYLLSKGSDPTAMIESFAKEKKITLERISMGQGQEEGASNMVKNGIASGGWVLLQNCHLGLKYLPILEEQLLSLETNETYNEGFRVWITTEPHEKFPINLLQMAIKVTDDPPTGIKAGLRKSYAWITQQMLEQVDTVEWRKLLYTTCFFHSTVIERKKYGPLGWCVPYEFNQSDLECSIHFLMKYLYETEKSKISWDTIRYMICDVQYGGRVTDTFDKVLLDCYGKKWYNSSIFSKEFEFYKNYGIPDSKKIEHYREYIEQLPMFDTPEVFGMHSNAELTFNSATAAYDLGTIMDIQPKQSSGSGGETRESKVLNICKAHLAKLPPDFNLVKVRKQCKKMGLDPLTIFLRQEIDRIQVVISLIRKTLTELQLAIAGTIIMSSELQDALNALYDARVPEKWIKVSWESPTLGYWFSDVLQRIQQYTSWLENGPPKVFWISGFFNTAGFLTAMKQQSTRAHPGWSLETVSLKTEVTKKEKDQIVVGDGEEGVYVYGLFLEGAAWDKRSSKLVDAKPKHLMNPLPVIHITAVNSVQSDEMSRMYICPVYKLPRRTALNYIFNLTLNTDEDPSVWTLRGVAALCSKM